MKHQLTPRASATPRTGKRSRESGRDNGENRFREPIRTDGEEDGTPEGTRTPYLLLRRQLLYPDELLARILEQVTRIELASPAWKAGALTIVLHLRGLPQIPLALERVALRIIAEFWGLVKDF